jgi:CubicO group peptidase (beta-lactamase class C family)
MSSLIPDDFVLSDSYTTAHTTIEDALCHRTGMPDHENSFPPSTTNVAGMVRILQHLPMTSGFREEFMYNNYMYSAVSHVLETRIGENMGFFLKDRIWSPLGMTKTYWTLKDAIAAENGGDARLARGFAWDEKGERYVTLELPDFPGVSGSGAIISNVLDYTKWLKCMMTRSAPLSAAGHASVVAPRIVVSSPKNNPFVSPNLYALGWYVDTYRGEKIIWHSGGWTGFGSVMAFLPNKQWGVAMMGNTSQTSNYVQMMLWFRLLDQLLKTQPEEQVDWNVKWNERVRKRREANARPRERLYPFLPINPTPPSLLLGQYAGSYSHPGYGEMNFVVDGEGLTADRTAQEIAMEVKLEHVSGEFWLAYLRVKHRDERDVEAVRAEFYISVEGKVNKFGVELEPSMGSNKIWFTRRDDGASNQNRNL